MTNVQIVDFQPWHADMMDLRGEFRNAEFSGRAMMASSGGPCITIFVDDVPIASIGITVICRGTAEIWVLACTNIKKYRKTLCKTGKWALAEARKRYGVKRFSASIDKDKVVQRRWAEFMGMHVESVMPRFGSDGETFIRYVLFME